MTLAALFCGSAACLVAEESNPKVAAAAAIPVEAFFARPPISAPELSPDGKKIAFLQLHEGRLGVSVYYRETGQGELIIKSNRVDFDTLTWKGNDHLIHTAPLRDQGFFFWGITDLSGEKQRELTYQEIGDTIVDYLPADMERIIIRDNAVRYSNLLTGER